MIGSWQALVFAVALASPALAQIVPPAQAVAPDADKPAPETCTDCRGGDAGRAPSGNAIKMTPEGKTIVPRVLIREQADFRVNEALRNVPGITRR